MLRRASRRAGAVSAHARRASRSSPTLTGAWSTDETGLDPSTGSATSARPSASSTAIRALLEAAGVTAFVELGPDAVLSVGMAQDRRRRPAPTAARPAHAAPRPDGPRPLPDLARRGPRPRRRRRLARRVRRHRRAPRRAADVRLPARSATGPQPARTPAPPTARRGTDPVDAALLGGRRQRGPRRPGRRPSASAATQPLERGAARACPRGAAQQPRAVHRRRLALPRSPGSR